MWRTAKPAVGRAASCQRVPARPWPLVSKRRPATIMKMWPRVRVDRDPLARPGRAEVDEGARRHRAVEQAGAGERERDRARAVVAVVAPGAVTAAPLVGELRDLVAGQDHPLDDVRRVVGRDRARRRPARAPRAGAQERGRAEVVLEAPQVARAPGAARRAPRRRSARRGSARRPSDRRWARLAPAPSSSTARACDRPRRRAPRAARRAPARASSGVSTTSSAPSASRSVGCVESCRSRRRDAQQQRQSSDDARQASRAVRRGRLGHDLER